MRILVVDDDPGTLNAIKAGLISRGHEVFTAKDAGTALRIIKWACWSEETIHLLLTDSRMPGMSGLDLILSAKVLYPGLSAILMTAYNDEAVCNRILALDGCGYLEKPFRPEIMMALIEEIKGDFRTMGCQAKIP